MKTRPRLRLILPIVAVAIAGLLFYQFGRDAVGLGSDEPAEAAPAPASVEPATPQSEPAPAAGSDDELSSADESASEVSSDVPGAVAAAMLSEPSLNSGRNDRPKEAMAITAAAAPAAEAMAIGTGKRRMPETMGR